ncbi:hypothetical protein ACHAXA_004627 [Cyclostephanos tholiformis]|uniref:Uncharacterized protein n=1 Tax=Cyclostephanos tholiformis TaxID=382380 RepID=A0ABD3SNZ6_9STRA
MLLPPSTSSRKVQRVSANNNSAGCRRWLTSVIGGVVFTLGVLTLPSDEGNVVDSLPNRQRYDVQLPTENPLPSVLPYITLALTNRQSSSHPTGKFHEVVNHNDILNESPDIKESSNYFKNKDNICAGSAPDFATTACDDLSIDQPQAGSDVTWGYNGLMKVNYDPHPNPFAQTSMCPINVHWHLGAEHRSAGQYDEDGTGPDRPLQWPPLRPGFSCHHYDASDTKFTTPYAFKYCKYMQVGETYEVHWPHSSGGACGTIYQYQTPFTNGVFCHFSEEQVKLFTPQMMADNVGIQGQVFTIVNDEDYFYPDLMRGMIVDDETMGVDITVYTGSSTGQTFDNTNACSTVTPITWHVDRKCHLISASSFDAMCRDMALQVSDMSSHLTPQGSRELVADEYAADNHLYFGMGRGSSDVKAPPKS